MNEELINQIVRSILSEPTFQALLHGNTARNQENRVVKPDGIVLLNYVPDFERVLTELKQSLGADYTLSILPSDQAFVDKPNLPEGMNWITPQDALNKTTWQKIILPACSPNTLAKAALGIRDNPISEIIGRGITQGIPTLLVIGYLGFTAQTPKAYQELYKGYLQTVQSYGVMVCATLEEGRTLNMVDQRSVTCEQKNAFNEQSAPSREVIRYEKKYLADKDAYRIAEESIVMVKRLTVISPLARDTLKMRRIELRQEMEEGRR